MTVSDAHREVLHNCKVGVVVSAKINFTVFALIQFILGAGIRMIDKPFTEGMKLLFRLIELQLNWTDQRFEYSIAEIRILRSWLEQRILHCERQRDEEIKYPKNPKYFNVDTYIGMKYLLLDLRDIMSCELIPTEE